MSLSDRANQGEELMLGVKRKGWIAEARRTRVADSRSEEFSGLVPDSESAEAKNSYGLAMAFESIPLHLETGSDADLDEFVDQRKAPLELPSSR